MIYNCAIDGGNSTILTIVEGEKVLPIHPTVTASREAVDYKGAISHTGNTKTTFDKLDVTVTMNRGKNTQNESSFLFGYFAEKFPASIRNREHGDKSSDKELITWMVTALAYALYEYKTKKGEKVVQKMRVQANLATGLPYHECRNVEKVKKYSEAFQGSHLIKFNHPHFEGLEIELVIERVFVYVEGEAGLETLIYDSESEYSKLKPEELSGSIVVNVDMGGFTSEVVGIEFNLHFEGTDTFDLNQEGELVAETRADLTTGIQKGIGHVMKSTITDIERNEIGIQRMLIRRDIENALGRKGLYDGKIGYVLPEKVYIKDYFDKHSKEYAVALAKALHGLYSDSNVKSRIRNIYLSGGGSNIDVVVETFKATLQELGYDTDLIISLKEPVWSNVLGYYIAMANELKESELELGV